MAIDVNTLNTIETIVSMYVGYFFDDDEGMGEQLKARILLNYIANDCTYSRVISDDIKEALILINDIFTNPKNKIKMGIDAQTSLFLKQWGKICVLRESRIYAKTTNRFEKLELELESTILTNLKSNKYSPAITFHLISRYFNYAKNNNFDLDGTIKQVTDYLSIIKDEPSNVYDSVQVFEELGCLKRIIPYKNKAFAVINSLLNDMDTVLLEKITQSLTSQSVEYSERLADFEKMLEVLKNRTGYTTQQLNTYKNIHQVLTEQYDSYPTRIRWAVNRVKEKWYLYFCCCSTAFGIVGFQMAFLYHFISLLGDAETMAGQLQWALDNDDSLMESERGNMTAMLGLLNATSFFLSGSNITDFNQRISKVPQMVYSLLGLTLPLYACIGLRHEFETWQKKPEPLPLWIANAKEPAKSSAESEQVSCNPR